MRHIRASGKFLQFLCTTLLYRMERSGYCSSKDWSAYVQSSSVENGQVPNVVCVVNEDPISSKYTFVATVELGSRSSLILLKQPPSPRAFGTPLPKWLKINLFIYLFIFFRCINTWYSLGIPGVHYSFYTNVSHLGDKLRNTVVTNGILHVLHFLICQLYQCLLQRVVDPAVSLGPQSLNPVVLSQVIIL